MKQNSKLMRASGILLVLTLMTLCFVGGTLAKYVSKGEGEDKARVAKWGVVVSVDGDGFHETYGKDNFNITIPGDNAISVKSTEKVVAPGTKGTFGGIEITGTPEVAVKIETTADVELSSWNVADDEEFYCPLVFKIGDQTINGLDYSKTTAGGETSFENAIKTAIEDATTMVVAPGTSLNGIGEDISYSWEWPFENSKGTAAEQDDILDTKLGDNAANDSAPTIKINVKTTVTQID
ncbi:MAG: hypothetical protein ACOX60_01485 [Massiliimalia sp.]|jgi:hypothetical protein